MTVPRSAPPPDLRMATDGGMWRKSSFSGSGNCVEVRTCACGCGAVKIRDSKAPTRTALRFAPAEWAAFLDAVKAGDFDQVKLNELDR